jgi:hypothetical protein
MVEFGKSFGYAKKSIMAYVGIWVIAVVLSILPVIGLLGGLLGTLQFWIINPILLGYAGYVAVKVGKGKLADGAMAGAIAGLVGSVVVAVLAIIRDIALLGVSPASQGGALGAGMEAGWIGLIGIAQLVMVVIVTIAGAVLGAVGAFFAQSQGPKKK